ncbi:MAG: carboxypeptidase regulatory-like domain-containing protein, partial [Magnetococcales bacterium]|nr:carboxypeptidase regulatory-like domain-containing protein [Magnetococcales bacterium]
SSYLLKGVPTADDYAVSLWRGNKGIYFARSGVTPSWSERTPVSVSGVTATTGIDFDLSAASTFFYTLTGTVGGLSADQVVKIQAWSDNARAATTLTGNGSFKLEGLPSGNYTVEVTSTGYASQHTGIVTVANGVITQLTWSTGWKNVGTVALTQDTTGLNVTLSKGSAIKGSVTNGTGTAMSGVLVNVWSDAESVGGSAVTNANGEFMVKGLPNSAYRVDVWTPDGSGSSSVAVSDADLSGVNLVVTKASGAITIKVIDKNSAVAGKALVLAYDQGTEKDRCVTDQGSGICTLDGLTVDSTYTIKVFSATKIHSGDWTTTSGYSESSGNHAVTNPTTPLELRLN